MSLGSISGNGKTITPVQISIDPKIDNNYREVGDESTVGTAQLSTPDLPPPHAKEVQSGGKTAPQPLCPEGSGVTLKGGASASSPATPLVKMDPGVRETLAKVDDSPNGAAATKSVTGAFLTALDAPSDPALDACFLGILGNYDLHPERATAAGPTMDRLANLVYQRFSLL